MKLSDELLLKSLRADVLSGVADDHWDLVCKAVDDAGDIREVRGYARTVIFDAIEKFNPNHDELGQFTSGGAGASGGVNRTNTGGVKRRSAGRFGASEQMLGALNDELTAYDNKKAGEAILEGLDDESTSILLESMQHEDDTTAFRMSNPYRANNAKVLLANLVAAQKWAEEHKQYTGKLKAGVQPTTFTEPPKKDFLDTTDIEPDMGTGAKSGKSSDAPTLDGMKVKQVKSTPSTVKRIMRALYDDDGPATSASEIADWVKSGDLKPSEVPQGWRSQVEAELNK